ncbi:hypothetical protein MLD38_018995 [Melastoma candidum]|uniref:Uncharacterized protein n=1 Tax=Melastoma candidum TaxID=119954 RepID=A0ACB9QYP0_9MYRT|nr:hypothetical protein MLD38_018995 [Melastoma candidum]
MSDDESVKQGEAEEKKYFLKVLEDVMGLNSLFTMAVFIGLSFALPGQVQSLDDNTLCRASASGSGWCSSRSLRSAASCFPGSWQRP